MVRNIRCHQSPACQLRCETNLILFNWQVPRITKTKIGTLMMTNVEVTYSPNDALRLSAGVDNLFNEYPDKIPQPVWDYNEERYANTNRQYLTGSPVGYFGARWFAKVAYNF